jgi:hypothetical protein
VCVMISTTFDSLMRLPTRATHSRLVAAYHRDPLSLKLWTLLFASTMACGVMHGDVHGVYNLEPGMMVRRTTGIPTIL